MMHILQQYTHTTDKTFTTYKWSPNDGKT